MVPNENDGFCATEEPNAGCEPKANGLLVVVVAATFDDVEVVGPVRSGLISIPVSSLF